MKPHRSLLCKKAVRAFALERAKEVRAGMKFEKVGQSFYDQIELHLRVWIDRYLHALPSNGTKTIK
jgi:hypothetical protein